MKTNFILICAILVLAGCGPRTKYMRITRDAADPNSFEIVYAETNGGFLVSSKANNLHIVNGERSLTAGEVEVKVDSDSVKAISKGVIEGIKGI